MDFKRLFITQPPGHSDPAVDAGEHVTLKRTLTAKDLVFLGIGAIIGAGIFVITGKAAADHAGPAIMIAFILAGTACAFAGLCYAEFAAMIPVSGSAYSYAYATLGEIVAWFIGWCLVLEYLFAASAVAVGWSGYARGLLDTLGIGFPAALSQAPITFANGEFVSTGALFNLPAVLIVAAVATLGYIGIRQSASVNAIIVTVKVVVILLFIGFGAQFIDTANWEPLIPANEGGDRFGWQGVVRAASIIFFAYIGFDAVSTAAAETKNPQRDMPIGILGSLVVCTVLYILVSGVMTGMVPFGTLGTDKPVATALEPFESLAWLKLAVEIGAIAGLTTVILVMLMGLPRIFLAVGRDGLLPRAFARVHPKFRTPSFNIVLVGTVAAVMAGMLPLGVLGDLVSMGTLLAFATVCIGVLVLRYKRPDLPRPFRVPLPWVVCIGGAASCLYLLSAMGVYNWSLLAAWTAVGFVIYFGYGYRHSFLRRARDAK